MLKRILLAAIVVVLFSGIGAYIYLKSVIPAYREGFIYAFGPYEFARSMQEISLQKKTGDGLFNEDTLRQTDPDWDGKPYLNRHIHNRSLVDHTARAVTTPNNDTLYTSAVLELSSTPVELIIPASGDRYLSVALMDMFSDQFAHIGPRETRGEAGTFWIVGPDDQTQPPENVTVIRATSNDVWLLGRIFVSGKSDLEAARLVQAAVLVRPVFPDRPTRPFETQVTDISDAENFLVLTNEILSRSPDHPHSKRAAEYASIGISPGKTLNDIGPVARFIWSRLAPKAAPLLEEQVQIRLASNTGWSSPPRNLGNYGDDDTTRAAISLIGFGALRREDAIYYRMTRTEDGNVLEGAKSYRMVIPPEGVPAEAFWSIALYEPDGTGRYFFYENPTGRHSINSKSEDIITQADGSIILDIGPEKPKDSSHVWLPTPDDPFAAFFRVYVPEESLIEGDWSPPVMSKQS